MLRCGYTKWIVKPLSWKAIRCNFSSVMRKYICSGHKKICDRTSVGNRPRLLDLRSHVRSHIIFANERYISNMKFFGIMGDCWLLFCRLQCSNVSDKRIIDFSHALIFRRLNEWYWFYGKHIVKYSPILLLLWLFFCSKFEQQT